MICFKLFSVESKKLLYNGHLHIIMRTRRPVHRPKKTEKKPRQFVAGSNKKIRMTLEIKNGEIDSKPLTSVQQISKSELLKIEEQRRLKHGHSVIGALKVGDVIRWWDSKQRMCWGYVEIIFKGKPDAVIKMTHRSELPEDIPNYKKGDDLILFRLREEREARLFPIKELNPSAVLAE